MEKQDIDKLELAAEGINEVVKIGELIMKDGSINFNDAQYADDLLEAVKKMIEAFKHTKEMGAEIKDIDLGESLILLQKIFK